MVRPENKQELNRILRGFDWLTDRSRSMSIHLMAGKGSGKSFSLGKDLCYRDFLKGIPMVVIEPNGGTIDNFLDKLIRASERLSPAAQERLWQRIRYVDMSGRYGYVVPWPLYYRLGNESLFEIAQRPLETIRRIDPHLQTASVEGWNALAKIGTHVGMILAALDLQITEAEDLLQNSKTSKWKGRFTEAVKRYPEVKPAVEFFKQDYNQWKADFRIRRTASFANKISQYALAPDQRALYGADTPIDWQEIVDQKITLLVDYRKVLDTERRRWGMMWVFQSFLAFIKTRGLGRHQPVSLVIDELSQMTLYDARSGTDMFSSDLDELINVIARNYSVWCTLVHQELFQLSDKMVKTLMACGHQVFGVTADTEAALTVVKELFPYDPTQVKRYEPVYSGNPPAVIDHRPVPYTITEWYQMATQTLKQLKTFQFLVRPAPGEGNITGKPQVMKIERDVGIWVDQERVAEKRQMLAERDGRAIGDILAEIENRQSQPLPDVQKQTRKPMKSSGQSVTLADNEPADANQNHLSMGAASPEGELADNAFCH